MRAEAQPALSRFGAVLFPLAVAIIAASLPMDAKASACEGSNDTHLNTNARKRYRVRDVSFDAIAGVSRAEGWSAVVLAAETWAHQANSGFFDLAGFTSDTTVDCGSPSGSLVRVIDGCDSTFGPGNSARAFARCNGTHFEIMIWSHRFDAVNQQCGDPFDWSVGSIGAGQVDLVGVVLHEFGHVLSLGHPATISGAVMQTGGFTGTTRKRDLYRWDKECAEIEGGSRQLQAFRRFHSSNGTFGTESNYLGTWRVARATASVTRHHVNDTLHWSSGFLRTSSPMDPAWTRDLNQSNTEVISTFWPGVGPRTSRWAEVSVYDSRLIWSDEDEEPQWYSLTSRLPIKTAYSTDGFSSSASSYLMECTNPTGLTTCGLFAWQKIYSPRMTAHAYLSSIGRTVTAWTQHDRESESENRRVRVSVGALNAWLVHQSDDLGVKSSVAPGLACRHEQAGGYDCMLAYVDPAAALNWIRIKRFSIVAGSNRYEIAPETGHKITNLRSGGDLALWYHSGTGRFYLAFRALAPTGAGQEVRVYSSADGDGGSWSHEASLGTGAAIGPAVSDWNVSNNVVVLVREN
jgi:hypothetical protein